MQLEIRDLSKTYPNGVKALKGISLDIPRGMFGLLGPNGAGKSTLMRTIATLQDPDAGTIKLGDIDVLRDKDGVRRVLGYLPQDFGVYPTVSAEDMLDHFAVLKGIMGQAIVTIDARKGVYKEQRRVLKRLAEALWSTDALWNAGADVLEPAFAADFQAADSDAERARVVVDQIASLTDQTALDWHSRLVGDIDPAEVGIWTPRTARAGARPHAHAAVRMAEGAH